MKLYKANVSFAGKVGMAVNEERRLADKDAAGLLKSGYISLVEETNQSDLQQDSDNEGEKDSTDIVTETSEISDEPEEQPKGKKK